MVTYNVLKLYIQFTLFNGLPEHGLTVKLVEMNVDFPNCSNKIRRIMRNYKLCYPQKTMWSG